MGAIRFRVVNESVIIVFGGQSPSDLAWDEFLNVLIRQSQAKGSVSLLMHSQGGGPTIRQQASLSRLFAGLPLRLGIVQTGAAIQPLLSTVAALQVEAFLYPMAALDEAALAFGLTGWELRTCLQDLVVDLHTAPPQAA
jgi:hypothetical protein